MPPVDFETYYTEQKSQLILRWIGWDLDTPVSAFLKLQKEFRCSFLLESVEGGAVIGRYSAIGLDPDLVWRYNKHEKKEADALAAIRRMIDGSRLDVIPDDAPPMAASGLFGYLGYGMTGLAETLPDENPDSLGIPDAILVRPSVMVIFDNVRQMVCIAAPVREHEGNSMHHGADAHAAVMEKIKAVEDILRSSLPVPVYRTSLKIPDSIQSNVSREQFHAIVEKAKEHIRAGDIFQVVPSQRLSMKFDLPAFAFYRSLRRLNPSPFLFFFDFGDCSLVGSSPEILVRVRHGSVTIRPIAGTRKRGSTATEDKALEQDLLNDPKERAEHLMLLDLARNDVGRVAKTGSVKVTDSFTIEHYSHVMHIVSNVEGRLREDIHPFDAMFAGFPAGTVSGAPKIRAMEIIDELEPERRSFYGGCVGYFDGGGNIDTCIALRTSLVKDGILYVQAGAGIVVDSDPESEYQETLSKARALIQAAEETLESAGAEGRSRSAR